MDLLFLTFGDNIKNHYQANFCILSFLAQPEEVSSISVYTDKPEFYTHLQAHVKVVEITEAILNDWKGPYDFFWRVKIKALEHFALAKPASTIVYLDSDTFLYNDVREFQRMLHSSASMHVREGNLAALQSKTEKKMWQQVQGHAFGGVTITASHAMWNAGVVAIPQENNLKAIRLALAICDDMCRKDVTRRLIEQFAISVALDETFGLKPADQWIGHYWGNKDGWNNFISNFLLESLLKGYTLDQDIARLKQFDFLQIPIIKKEKNTKLRLQRFLNKVFPPKEVAYIK